MNEIYWDSKRFRFLCSNLELEEECYIRLSSTSVFSVVCKHMQALGFDVETIAVTLVLERQFPESLEFKFYPKGLHLSSKGFPIEKMGTGFAICFYLIGYALAAQDSGSTLRVHGESFKYLLHPNLYRFLSLAVFPKAFSRECRVYRDCQYFSGSEYLKCAVNPSLPCADCQESPDSFSGHGFEWVE